MNLRLALFLLALLIGAREATSAADPPTCLLELALVDGNSRETLPGIVQIVGENESPVTLQELVNRGQGIEQPGPIHNWWVLPKPVTVNVPQAPLTVRALAGLETELAVRTIDLTGKSRAKLEVPLVRFHRARPRGQLAGNTHLHLMKLSKAQADRYLAEVPLCDGLDIVFLSYLERAKADLEYTSNNYSRRDLEKMSHGHVHFGHGQEHRHNFGSHGEGYGHILLLDIPYIIRPVSIGPGIMLQGSDAPPLQAGIDERRTGGKVVWAHNLYGFEDIPNWITGRVDANNIYDGSHRGSYKDTYYRYLNIGLSVPFSTGTDWFIYDFSRVYVLSDGRPVTPTGWLDLLTAGRSFITNGPLLEFTVDGQPVGSRLKLAATGEVAVKGRAAGRVDFKRIELVVNGRVVESSASSRQGDHYVATLDLRRKIDGPSWLALRTVPPAVADDPTLQEPVADNEFGGKLFSHTSPIYIDVAGRGVFDRATAEGLVDEMKASVESIKKQAHFADEAERNRVLTVYDEAIRRLDERLGR